MNTHANLEPSKSRRMFKAAAVRALSAAPSWASVRNDGWFTPEF
jgi:hypothetical protein